VTVYEVGTVKDVGLDGGLIRAYISVDGGMSDNIRTALYDAEYTCALANRSSTAEPKLSRVVGKHCESGDIVVRDTWLPADVGAGDLLTAGAWPATTTTCRARPSSVSRTAAPPFLFDGKPRTTCCGSTRGWPRSPELNHE
jgi:diaminopimelate decarboxylase